MPPTKTGRGGTATRSRLVLSDALTGHHELLAGLADHLDRDDALVHVSLAGECSWRTSAADEAAAAGRAWIDLVLDPTAGVRLGPLSSADHPACSVCADVRIAAAAAGRPAASAEAAALADLADLAEIGAALLARADTRRRGQVLAVDTAATAITAHTVVAVPGCPNCPGPRPGAAAGGIATGDPVGVLTQLSGWTDPLTGVIPTVRLEQPLGSGPGRPTIATAAPPHLPSAAGLRAFPIGWGKGLDPAGALVSAVGEAVERYSASLPDPDRLVFARADELAGDVLGPGAFPLYSAAQYDRPDFPFARFDRSVIHPWVRGHWYGSDRPVWVPAVFAYLHLRLRADQHIVQGTSNGLAAGATDCDAAERAVLELVERDAFLTAWRTGRGLAPVPIESVDGAYQPTLAGLAEFGVRVTLARLTTSVGAPVMAAFARGDGHATPGLAIGMAADPSAARAAGQAVLELAQTVPHLTMLMRSGQLPTPASPAAVSTLMDHAAYFFPAARAEAAYDRLFGRPSQGRSASARPADVRIAIVDVTAPDVASGPFRVARAVSPDLAPLTFGHGLERGPAGAPLHPVW